MDINVKESLIKPLSPKELLLTLSRGYAILYALFGLLFGQLFFETFDIPLTIAGICGILAGSFGGTNTKLNGAKKITIVCCTGGLLGVLGSTLKFYSEGHNGYPWFVVGIFCFALVIIASSTIKYTAKLTPEA